MIIEKRKFRLHGFTNMLGSQPADPEVRAKWIASRAPAADLGAEEQEGCPDTDDKGITVFPVHPKKGNIILWDYMMRGYLKSAFESNAAENGVKQPKSKIDKFVFVSPRCIPITRGGAEIYGCDNIRERPLRASTMMGPRVTLASSEEIEAPWDMEIAIELFENNGTASSKKIGWETIEEALNFGFYQGIGQWRTGGNGRFCWEEIDANGKTVKGVGNMERLEEVEI